MRNPARRLALAAALACAVALFARADEPPRRFPPDRPIDVRSIDLDLDVDFAARAIAGTATIELAALRDGVATVELDAVDLEIRAVRGAAEHRATGEKLVLRLPEPLARGAVARVEIDYRARPREGVYFFAPDEDAPEVSLQLWTQGESVWARRWFPCVDTPEERQRTSLSVRVPAGLEAISNGALLGKEGPDAEGKVRFRYAQRVPHTAYLVALVVGDFAVWRDEWEGIPLIGYVPKDSAADAARSFENTKAMMAHFSERIGIKYPYEKYAQACVEQFIHGGMENTTITTLNDDTLHDERAHLDFSSDGLIAHELAHQWWGDLITCRDWAHIWLNEGFASYFEAVWEEKKGGADEYDYCMFEKTSGALAGGREAPLVRRRYEDPDECFGGGTYPKGAWVLHMLRRALGEEDFWRGLRAYARDHRESAVETEDLRRSFERETGRSLGRFFWDWTERTGHPVLDVALAWSDETRLLEVTVEQMQPGEAFAFDCDLAIVEDGGARRAVPLRVRAKEERFLVPLAARPRWVRFDDREAVLKELTLRCERDWLLAALEDEPRAIARIDAARALARDPSAEVVEALGRALRREPFWGAGVELARLLGEIPGDEARDALLAATGAAHPKVRRAVVEALGSFHRDPKVAETLLALARKPEPSVFVEAAIGRALARTRHPAAFEVLSAMLEKDSSREELRRAALAGFEELPDLRGLAPARAHMRRGGRVSLRAAAIETAGRLAARRECDEPTRRAVAEEIAALLAERHPRVRGAAIQALREMGGAPGAAGPGVERALEALARHDPRDHIRDAARGALERIRASQPADQEIVRLREEIRKHAEESRELRERLERLEARGAAEGKGAAAPAGPK